MNSEIFQHDLPLIELFTRLRQASLPLGIEEYQVLIRALQHGFGQPDRAALEYLCKTLWIKSREEERLFDYHFSFFFPAVPDEASSTDEEDFVPLSGEPALAEEESVSVNRRKDLLDKGNNVSIDNKLATASELPLRTRNDNAQIALALQHTSRSDTDLDDDTFVQTDEYFPITRRQMKQSWRYLRRPLRQGPRVELDIEATVHQAGRLGILLELVLVPRRINQAELFLLIDQGGSMVPFHALSRRLADTAVHGGRLGKAHIYYFHNWPEEYLYHDAYRLKIEPVQDVLSQIHAEHAVVLILSDAGAARGGFNETRIDQTAHFLEQLKQCARHTAWLNPMPRSRWLGTTASEIMYTVPMFDISRRGLDQAINVLRGRPTPFGPDGMRR